MERGKNRVNRFTLLLSALIIVCIDVIVYGIINIALNYRLLPSIIYAYPAISIATVASIGGQLWSNRRFQKPSGLEIPQPEAQASVKVVNVEKTYRLGENDVHALKGIDLEIRKGEFVAFMGPSGSGKTTLLNLIGVLDKPSKGKIYIDGIDLTNLKEQNLTNLRRSTIGFIFQFYNLIPVLSAFENVELPMLIAGVPPKEREKRAQELLKMVGLADRIHHRPDELSGGEQQRVAIVRALANKPSIVLADEPTGDLDSKTGQEVVQALRDLSNREGATVIMVTHDPTIASMATKVFDMRDGLIINEHTNNIDA